MKKRYLSNKTLDVINDNTLDIMYFVKEYMNDECNRILRLGDEIRKVMIDDRIPDKEKQDLACMKMKTIKKILDKWNGAPEKAKRFATDICNQLCGNV